MNLPSLMQQIYGELTFTGLYSFEFVDKNRNTIIEIFFMMPPKSKSVTEPTRSSVVPTLGGNYVNDAGNATKNITLSGDLYFPYVGSPDNPVAKFNNNLSNQIDGLSEFFKLRWMLIRYRDYTMTRDGMLNVPVSVLSKSLRTGILYRDVAKKLKNKTGALYDEIQLIFHDYDMDDHFYCRVDNFSSNQNDKKHIAMTYTISLECYEPDNLQVANKVVQTKKQTNESVDVTNLALQNIDFENEFDEIQAQIGYNSGFVSASTEITETIENINTENTAIQAGQSTALSILPIYVSTLLSSTNTALAAFIDTFLSATQQSLYEVGDLTLDEILDMDLIAFYNSLQKVKIFGNQMLGTLNAIENNDEIRYYSDADDYTLTEEQFDSENENKVENTTTFFFYTVMEGDTARIIAQRELNDSEKFINILKINDISENDFIDGNLIGEKIKIPLATSTIARGDENLVYYADSSNIDMFLYGSDIKTGINDEILISATGDILDVFGIDNVYESIEKRIENYKGSLNVFNPNWGTVAIDDGNAPLMVKIDRYLTDVVMQIQEDPRVESVKMELDKLIWSGETVSVPFTIYFVGTEEPSEVAI